MSARADQVAHIEFEGDPIAQYQDQLATPFELNALYRTAAMHAVDPERVVFRDVNAAVEELAADYVRWLSDVTNFRAVLERHGRAKDPLRFAIADRKAERLEVENARLRAGLSLTLFYAERLTGVLEGENTRRVAREQLAEFAGVAGVDWRPTV